MNKKHPIDKIDFREHKTCIFGIQGGGKSILGKRIVKTFEKPIIYRVNPDWDDEKNVFIFKPDSLINDFPIFTKQARQWAIEGKIDCIVIDEADMFLQWNYDIDENLHDLVLNHRHRGRDKRKGVFDGKTRGYGVALIFISRRPQDIPTKIVESSKHICVFKIEGANAIKKFNNIRKGFGGMLEYLDDTQYEFYYKKLGKEPVKMPKVPLD